MLHQPLLQNLEDLLEDKFNYVPHKDCVKDYKENQAEEENIVIISESSKPKHSKNNYLQHLPTPPSIILS